MHVSIRSHVIEYQPYLYDPYYIQCIFVTKPIYGGWIDCNVYNSVPFYCSISLVYQFAIVLIHNHLQLLPDITSLHKMAWRLISTQLVLEQMRTDNILCRIKNKYFPGLIKLG